MFNPWFLPSLTLENRGLEDLMLRTVSDPDVRARSLVCCAPMVRDHYPNDSVQSTTAADKHKGKRPELRKQQCPDNDRAKRMVHVIGIRRHTDAAATDRAFNELARFRAYGPATGNLTRNPTDTARTYIDDNCHCIHGPYK